MKKLQPEIFNIIADSKTKINNWDKERERLESSWLEINHEMIILSDNVLFNQKPQFKDFIDQFNTIKQHYEKRNTNEVVDLKNKLLNEIESFKKSTIDESVRKNVVAILIKILKDMDFEISKPKIQTIESGASQVILKSASSKGELISFRIEQDGKTHFELENFQKTYCKDRIELIRTDLETKMNSQVKIEQWEWHNPDLLKKGARDLPQSGSYLYKSK